MTTSAATAGNEEVIELPLAELERTAIDYKKAIDVSAVIGNQNRIAKATSLADKIQNVADAAPQFTALKSQLYNQISVSADKSAKIAADSGTAAGIDAGLIAAANFKTQETIQMVSKAAGTNATDPNSELMQSIQTNKEAVKLTNKINQDILDNVRTPFWPNPGKAIINAFKLPGQIEDRNTAQGVVLSSSGNISKLVGATTDAALVTRAAQSSLDINSAERASRQAANAWALKTEEFSRLGGANQIGLLTEIEKGNQTEVDNLIKKFELQTKAEYREEVSEQRKLRITAETDAAKVRNDKVADQKEFEADVSEGMKRMGLGPSANSATIANMNKSPEGKEQLAAFKKVGVEARHTGTVAAGNNVVDAINTIKTAGADFSNSPFKPGAAALGNVLDSMPPEIAKGNQNVRDVWLHKTLMGSPGVKGTKDTPGISEKPGLLAGWYADPESSGLTRMAAPSVLGKASPALFTTPLFSKVIAPLIEGDKNLQLTLPQIMALSKTAYDNGVISMPDIINGVGDYVKVGMQVNAGNLRFFGLEPQKTYTVSVPVPGRAFGNDVKQYNMADHNQRQMYFTDIAVRSFFGDAGRGINPGPRFIDLITGKQ